MVFMDEISGPSPQIIHFIRNHGFPRFCTLTPQARRDARRRPGCPSGYLKPAQRQYEQDVYDFSRNLGLPMNGAENWVLKAREFWSEKDHDGMDTEENDDFSNCDATLGRTSNVLSPEMLRLPLEPIEHSDQAPGDSTSCGFPASTSLEPGILSAFGPSQASMCAGESKGKNETANNMRLIAENEPNRAKQFQHGELQNSDRHSKDNRNMPATLRSPILRYESFADSLVSHKGDISRTETEIKDGEKAARKAAKAARKAQRKAEREATRQVQECKSQMQEHEQITNPKGQVIGTDTLKDTSQLEQLEGTDKPQPQKKKGRKHQRDQELPAQSEVEFGEHHKHKKSRVDSGTQEAKPRKSKTNEGGPQYSPFFQRTRVTETEKGVNTMATKVLDFQCSGSKAKKKDAAMDTVMGFRSPMIQ